MDDLSRTPRVALDARPIIYSSEANPEYLKVIEPVFEAIAQGQRLSVTSISSLIEALTHPLRLASCATTPA